MAKVQRKAHPLRLSSIDMHAVYMLEKYGELLKDESGKYFGRAVARRMLEVKRIEKLARHGICRIDVVGESTFAVFVGMP